MFEPLIEKTIETFNNVTAWPMAMAHNLPIEAVGRAPAVGDALTAAPVYRPARPAESAVAWLVDWRQYRADALAAELLTEGYRIQAAGEPLTIQAGDERRSFGRGTLIIHAGVQPERLDAVGPRLAELSEKHGVEVVAAEGSLVADGIDLGSPSAHMLKAPRPAMLTGTGINAYGAGTLWHWFDTRLEQPLARIDTDRLGRVNLNDYSHVIVPPTVLADWARIRPAGWPTMCAPAARWWRLAMPRSGLSPWIWAGRLLKKTATAGMKTTPLSAAITVITARTLRANTWAAARWRFSWTPPTRWAGATTRKSWWSSARARTCSNRLTTPMCTRPPMPTSRWWPAICRRPTATALPARRPSALPITARAG